MREGFRTVVAAGGDGTVNEVLRGIVGTSARLGVLPVGTVNVFAREMGIPLDWEDALLRISQGREQLVDVGWANGSPFVQLAGVGWDAQVVQAVCPEAKRVWGAGAYLWSALGEMGNPMPPLRVEADGLPPVEGCWVLVGLGRYYGGPLPVFPLASQTDGMLDVLVVKEMGWGLGIRSLLTLPWGWHTRLEGVTYFQSARFRVIGDASYQLDGEVRGGGPVEFGASFRHLRVLV
ncbi:MAG: hypothetical protein RLZZ399_1441 [Verrucomicrobiota bacterium]